MQAVKLKEFNPNAKKNINERIDYYQVWRHCECLWV
jgi:hypothetical protein